LVQSSTTQLCEDAGLVGFWIKRHSESASVVPPLTVTQRTVRVCTAFASHELHRPHSPVCHWFAQLKLPEHCCDEMGGARPAHSVTFGTSALVASTHATRRVSCPRSFEQFVLHAPHAAVTHLIGDRGGFMEVDAVHVGTSNWFALPHWLVATNELPALHLTPSGSFVVAAAAPSYCTTLHTPASSAHRRTPHGVRGAVLLQAPTNVLEIPATFDKLMQ
jgi:hypothetical protein